MANVAQLVEQLTRNEQVVCSNQIIGSTPFPAIRQHRLWMDEAEGGVGGGDAGEHAHEDFHARVAEEFLKLFFRQVVLVQQFIDDLVEERSLLPCGGTDALGIEHDHHGKGEP